MLVICFTAYVAKLNVCLFIAFNHLVVTKLFYTISNDLIMVHFMYIKACSVKINYPCWQCWNSHYHIQHNFVVNDYKRKYLLYLLYIITSSGWNSSNNLSWMFLWAIRMLSYILSHLVDNKRFEWIGISISSIFPVLL